MLVAAATARHDPPRRAPFAAACKASAGRVFDVDAGRGAVPELWFQFKSDAWLGNRVHIHWRFAFLRHSELSRTHHGRGFDPCDRTWYGTWAPCQQHTHLQLRRLEGREHRLGNQHDDCGSLQPGPIGYVDSDLGDLRSHPEPADSYGSCNVTWHCAHLCR